MGAFHRHGFLGAVHGELNAGARVGFPNSTYRVEGHRGHPRSGVLRKSLTSDLTFLLGGCAGDVEGGVSDGGVRPPR